MFCLLHMVRVFVIYWSHGISCLAHFPLLPPHKIKVTVRVENSALGRSTAVEKEVATISKIIWSELVVKSYRPPTAAGRASFRAALLDRGQEDRDESVVLDVWVLS